MSFLVQKAQKQLLRPNFFLTPKWDGEGTLPPFSWALLPLSHPEFRLSFWLSSGSATASPSPTPCLGAAPLPHGIPWTSLLLRETKIRGPESVLAWVSSVKRQLT